MNKIPAVVQDVVEVVALKKKYHTLRNLGASKKGIFEMNADVLFIFISEYPNIH